MPIDPLTGLAVPFAGDSMGAEVGSHLAQGYGMTPESNSALFGMLEHFPTVTQTAGANAWRGQRTILKGGWSRSGKTGALRNHNLLNPFMYGRLSSTSTLSASGGRGGGYTPFNYAARGVNWGATKLFSPGLAATALDPNSLDAGLAKGARAASLVPGEGQVYASNAFFARTSAMSKLARTSGPASSLRSVDRRMNAAKFIMDTDEILGRHISALGHPASLTNRQMGSFIGMSSKGTLNQFVSGYIAQSMGIVDESVLKVANAAGRQAFVKGSARATAHLAEGGSKAMLARTAAQAGRFLPGVNIALAAWTAADLIGMAAAGLGGIGRTAKDAAYSMRGSIQKPVMGMGYKDNTVAATSRARGVMAIANSRMNARSVLGSESMYMASHFG